MDTSNNTENKYASRKFIVTTASILATVALAYTERMTGDTSVVLAAAIASYNWANSRTK